MAIRRFTHAVPPLRVLTAMAVVLTMLLGLVGLADRAGAADGPSVTVTPDTDLVAEGAVLAVAGTGFSGNPIYVAMGPAGLHDVPNWNMQANLFTGAAQVSSFDAGSFTKSITVNAVFTSGTTEVDCREVECGIYTWRNHTDFGDRTQDTYTPVTFATEADGPSVTVTPDTDLVAEGAVLAVAGTGFSGNPIYVAMGPAGLHDVPNWNMQANLFTGAAQVSSFDAGSFTKSITVNAVFTSGTTEVDCREVECGIYTWRNHTDFGDRTQDTYTPVTFASSEPTTTTTEPEPTTTTTTAPEPTTTTTPEPEVITIEGGHLDWGVKASFRSYIEGPVADGTITTAGGATTNADGTFRFPVEDTVGEVAADGSTVVADFGGSVHFSGHDGALEMDISDIVVTLDGDAGSLQADVTSKDLDSGEVETYTDVELATLDLSSVTPTVSDTTVTWPGMPATLTEAGVPAFSGNYAAGDALDPATMVLDLSEVPDLPGGSGGAATDPAVAAIDRTTVVPGGQMTVSGSGFTPGEQVEVMLHSDPVWVGTVTATSEGTASLTFTVPTDTAAGSHHLEMRGITSGHVATSPTFQVLAAGAVPVSGSLPYTGSDVLPLGLVALVLLAGGSAAVVATRRRRTVTVEA